MCETAYHETNHSDMDKGDTGCGQSFIVFGKATIEAESSEGTFDNPTTGQ